MKSTNQQVKNQKKKSQIMSPGKALLILVAAVICIFGIGWFWISKSTAPPEPEKTGHVKYIAQLSKLAQQRWEQEQKDAKAQGRAPDESLRPGPNMKPINDMTPPKRGSGPATIPSVGQSK
jgi:hypothetical protein